MATKIIAAKAVTAKRMAAKTIAAKTLAAKVINRMRWYLATRQCLHCHLIVEMFHERGADPVRGSDVPVATTNISSLMEDQETDSRQNRAA